MTQTLTKFKKIVWNSLPPSYGRGEKSVIFRISYGLHTSKKLPISLQEEKVLHVVYIHIYIYCTETAPKLPPNQNRITSRKGPFCYQRSPKDVIPKPPKKTHQDAAAPRCRLVIISFKASWPWASEVKRLPRLIKVGQSGRHSVRWNNSMGGKPMVNKPLLNPYFWGGYVKSN